MSEEILKALTQLFAIFSKQDGGVKEEEREYVISFFNQELDQDSIKEYLEIYDKLVDYGGEKKAAQRMSVKDSVRTLGLCRKINKTLTQKQKIVVLIKIMELVKSDKEVSATELEILTTVADVFNFESQEYELIRQFIFYDQLGINDEFDSNNIIQVLREVPEETTNSKFLQNDLDGHLIFLKVKSVDMYFVKYIGDEEINLNAFIIKSSSVYLFSHGSTIKMPSGGALYYSDIIAKFNPEYASTELSFEADNIVFKFPNGGVGLRNINISEGPGKLLGIMGASGAGKTTLLNVLAGIEVPSSGTIKINNIDINKDKNKVQGVIGYVSQDDLLIEELTVYENLYYNAKLCFNNLKEEELHERVMGVLASLGLDQRKDLRVGSALDKTISGGQRKRLNIALELIREPAVMFVDEPTSGLSSRDSENVIDLLKELSLKGKLIFVVIHQPSSDIYKMFDKMFLLDTGGYTVYYGNPVEAITYFKEVTHQVDKIKGQCSECGSVNPEQIFNIIESQVVDEYGQLTNKRKVTPTQWNEHYLNRFELIKVDAVKSAPPNLLAIPSKIKQSIIFSTRDLISKWGNKQYILINFLEAPLLAFLLAFIIKYTNTPDGNKYSYQFNDNLPVFILMSIVVALFMGLSVSAEEIIKDRKILKREAFLNLNRNSYLMSKVSILFTMSAIQTLTFSIVGCLILEMPTVILSMWLILFTISCTANLIGLNVSSAFNSAITVYILIPIILIPQMILSGLMFEFDKLHGLISSREKVPIIADCMASRWGFEAIVVDMYKSNLYEKPYFELDKQAVQADFVTAYIVPEMRDKVTKVNIAINDKEGTKDDLETDINIIRNTLSDYTFLDSGRYNIDSLARLENINEGSLEKISAYLNELEAINYATYAKVTQRKDKLVNYLEGQEDYKLNEFKDKYFNQSLEDLVRKVAAERRTEIVDDRLIQLKDPVYNEKFHSAGMLDYRTQFYASSKPLFGTTFDTYWFNISIIWLMSIVLYATLYFELLAKGLSLFNKIKISKSS